MIPIIRKLYILCSLLKSGSSKYTSVKFLIASLLLFPPPPLSPGYQPSLFSNAPTGPTLKYHGLVGLGYRIIHSSNISYKMKGLLLTLLIFKRN